MSELFHDGSGQWNQPGNQSAFAEVAKEPAKEQVKGVDNRNMFGSGATTPSTQTGGHGQLPRPEKLTENGPKSAEHQGKEAVPKKSTPFV